MNDVSTHSSAPSPAKPAKGRWLLFAAACVITLVALFYAEENWRGRHAWLKYRQELESKGEKLALRELLPPAVPEDKNFALAPLLKPILDYTQGPGGVTWQDTNGWARLDRFSTVLPLLNGTNLSLGSLEKGTFADVTEWSEHYRQNTNAPDAKTLEAIRRRYGLESRVEAKPEFAAAAPGATAAQVVLAGLSMIELEMRELREAAATRSCCRFPVRYEDEPPVGVLLPHLARVKLMATVLQVRATAELDAGNAAEALQDLKLGLRVSDSIREEPLIISHLVRVAILGNCLQTIREGLVRHAWSDGELAELEASLRDVNLLAEHKVAMRGDRAGMLAELEYMRRHGAWGIDVTQIFGEGATVCERMIRFGPRGWAYQNMLSLSRYIQDYVLAAVDEPGRRLLPEVSDHGTAALRAYSGRDTLFVKVTQTGFERAIQQTGRMQTFVDATRVGCALERWRLANGALPETLAALAPRFIEGIPNDIIDGQPLRWKRDGARYLLYSVGWNKTDDGGELGWNRNDDTGIHGFMKEKAGPWVDPAKGDWVWEMTVR